MKWDLTEAVTRRYSLKKVFLKILLNSQENACATVSFLIKLQAWGLERSFWRRCLPVNFAKFLRHLRWLFLNPSSHCSTSTIGKEKWFLIFKSRLKTLRSAKQTSSYCVMKTGKDLCIWRCIKSHCFVFTSEAVSIAWKSTLNGL